MIQMNRLLHILAPPGGLHPFARDIGIVSTQGTIDVYETSQQHRTMARCLLTFMLLYCTHISAAAAAASIEGKRVETVRLA